MSAELCRTCLRPITHETRTEPGYLPREGWYDDCRTDALVCFKAVGYRHVPLTDRERAYYDAGTSNGLALAEELLRKVLAYWDGRPLAYHGTHIHADLCDVLKAITPAPKGADA